MVSPPIGVVELAIFLKMNACNAYIEWRTTCTPRVAFASKLKKRGNRCHEGFVLGARASFSSYHDGES
eukprot:scaffold1019_cov338-Pavlova_lutheri.AAC.22